MNKLHVTLNDVKQLAAQLSIAFLGGEQDDPWFDLDTKPDAPCSLHGTYQKSAAGIAAAYGDLIRYQDRINQVGQPSNLSCVGARISSKADRERRERDG